MDCTFYRENRAALYAQLEEGALVLLFAGKAYRKSADAYFPFYANRNFVYLSGMEGSYAQGFVFLAEKRDGAVKETLFILPPDAYAERWQGRRITAEEARQRSGIEHIAYLEQFPSAFHRCANSNAFSALYLSLDRLTPEDPADLEHRFAQRTREDYPCLRIANLMPHLRRLRTIKKPCEIEAMRRSMCVTREAILDMMQASRPGMYEYEYKAIFDAALTRNGVLAPGFPSILSAGANNFCIHYDAYTGQAQDGDMFLCDVGACWDGLGNDVSRGFPVNGTFSPRQQLLYRCAYETSEYMFAHIRPGMPMQDVDKTVRQVCFEHLREIGLVQRFEEVGKYIWHGGAHHLGFDTHDVVDASGAIVPGMVFCVDVGIYCEEWGIGFRLEDNCLVTETGCENLSASIPRSMEEIEAAMRK